jgi:hypothetical protein
MLENDTPPAFECLVEIYSYVPGKRIRRMLTRYALKLAVLRRGTMLLFNVDHHTKESGIYAHFDIGPGCLQNQCHLQTIIIILQSTM